jgi:Ca2+:H+ antiporter
VLRTLLWASLVLGPLVVVLDLVGAIGDVAAFALSALALVPLAWLIGEATEHAAHHTGPGVGGFINATFGNAPELIIALIAVNQGLANVVRGSLIGSIVGNLLLVLGFSLALGGRGPIDRTSSFTSIGLVALATGLLLIPSVPGWSGNPTERSIEVVSLVVSIVLFAVYIGVTWRALRRHHQLHVAADPVEMTGWSFRRALGVLAIATVVTAFVAEVLVGSLETFADAAGLSDFFVAAVIVAIVGNAAEHGGAVVIARRGNIELAAEIALASSAQVAVFLIPVVTILSWAIEPLELSFRQIELGVLAAAAAVTAAILADGRSARWKGALLIIAYALAAAAFYVAGDPS